MTDEQASLAKNFQDFFKIEIARTKEQKSKVYGIRYRVYCNEFGYEPIDEFPDKEEKDEYDDFSIHCLIIHKKSGHPAACVRLVPAFDGQHKATLLPLELHCEESIDHEYINNLHLDRETVCEISRLAIDCLFRRRTGEKLTRFGEVQGLDFSKQEQRTFSLIAVAALLAAAALTEINGKPNAFSLMEPFLPRMMKRSGINFIKAGTDTDYKGVRAPYFIQIQLALDNMHDDLKELYIWIYEQVDD